MENRSFTVIELLVVIALIGLLASIVLVSFNLPEKRYRATVAKSLEFSQSIQNAIGIDAAGWWNFDDEITDGNVTDTSGNGNTGTLCDSTGCGAGKGPSQTGDTPHKVAGIGGGKYALSFDGADDYVNVGSMNAVNGLSQLTIAGWVKRGVIGRGALFFKVQDATHWIAVSWHSSSGLYFAPADISNYASISPPIGTDWKYYTFVFDGTQTGNTNRAKIYVNGVMQTASFTGTIPAITSSPTATAMIGRDWWNNWSQDGLIDDVRIYGQALTVQQIQQHYVEGLERHQDLAAK